MAAGGIGQGGSLGPALDHMQHIESGHRLFAEPVAPAKLRKSGAFLSRLTPAALIQALRYSSSGCNQRRVFKPPK